MQAVDAQYTRFFTDEFAGVVRVVYLILHDRGRAEEISQEAFLQLLLHWTKVSRYERPEAWVRRAAIRLAMRVVRRERVWALIKGEVRPPSNPVPRDLDLLEAIRQLPGAQRAATVLFYLEDRPVVEIATILGCSEGTARVHLHRARRRLATLLGEGHDRVA